MLSTARCSNVTKDATLKELKTIYRNSMKDHHPDTIADDAERLAAEARSTAIIEAYHFLVSVAPETLEKPRKLTLPQPAASRLPSFIMTRACCL